MNNQIQTRNRPKKSSYNDKEKPQNRKRSHYENCVIGCNYTTGQKSITEQKSDKEQKKFN